MPAPDRKIPSYISRPRLIEELDISDRTLDSYIAKGFPKPGRHGKFNWAKVCRYMDGGDEEAVASPGGQSDRQLQEIDDAHREFTRSH
jgi:hypothetical protein